MSLLFLNSPKLWNLRKGDAGSRETSRNNIFGRNADDRCAIPMEKELRLDYINRVTEVITMVLLSDGSSEKCQRTGGYAATVFSFFNVNSFEVLIEKHAHFLK
ncbi:hypothetical protein HHI36_012732 [Cryptolaemus montrouzieri]|uniref:Uncharacterized protein n=1 Tax=Cryptolaemus montrouzieri TaxID=559131 RepID=A0ABD2NF38_9CUCU